MTSELIHFRDRFERYFLGFRGDAFQGWFEQLAFHTYGPDFLVVLPHGSKGDAKADGLDHKRHTVFQVHAPKNKEIPKLRKKISDDFQGAKKNFLNMRRWVFVHNDKGTYPEVHELFQELQDQNPSLEIEYMGRERLWLLAESLPPAKRAIVFDFSYNPAAGVEIPLYGLLSDAVRRETARSGRFTGDFLGAGPAFQPGTFELLSFAITCRPFRPLLFKPLEKFCSGRNAQKITWVSENAVPEGVLSRLINRDEPDHWSAARRVTWDEARQACEILQKDLQLGPALRIHLPRSGELQQQVMPQVSEARHPTDLRGEWVSDGHGVVVPITDSGGYGQAASVGTARRELVGFRIALTIELAVL